MIWRTLFPLCIDALGGGPGSIVGPFTCCLKGIPPGARVVTRAGSLAPVHVVIEADAGCSRLGPDVVPRTGAPDSVLLRPGIKNPASTKMSVMG